MKLKPPSLNGWIGICVALILVAYFFAMWILLRSEGAYEALASPRGFDIADLGQFGDSVAPITCLFALVAAIGAWKSYGAQREHLNLDKGAVTQSRFDETFARTEEVVLQVFEKHFPQLTDYTIGLSDVADARAAAVTSDVARMEHLRNMLLSSAAKRQASARILGALSWLGITSVGAPIVGPHITYLVSSLPLEQRCFVHWCILTNDDSELREAINQLSLVERLDQYMHRMSPI